MEFNYISIIIFSLSMLTLAFAIGLWLGRPKINSSKEKTLEKTRKMVKGAENNNPQKISLKTKNHCKCKYTETQEQN